MSYNIEIDNKLKIIRYTHSGNIGKNKIGKAWEDLFCLKEFTDLGYNLLSDYRNAVFNLSIEDIDLISDFLFKFKEILNNKKQSIVICDTKSVAMSLMFEPEIYSKVGFNVKVFSTIENAVNWLNI